MSEYSFSTKLRDKVVKYRKWKVKDKKKYMSSDDPIILKEALVFDCIEDKNIALDAEEYKYMLMKIRNVSIKNEIKYDFTCSHCSNEFEYTADIEEIMTPEFKDYDDIISGKHIFTLTHVRNRQFYENSILGVNSEEEKVMVDFIMHVKSYNDNDGLNFDELNEIINELDIEDFEAIFKEWENMKFYVNNIHDVECPKCAESDTYEFDDLPNFFPESWKLNAEG